jgi:RNA polymerase sigma-70 factor (ECF subfamily)
MMDVKRSRGLSSIESAYRSNTGSLKRFLRRFFESTADIEDIMQEAFLKAYEAEHTTDIKQPRAFLFRTARNLAINEQAKRRNRHTDAVADLEALTVLFDAHADSRHEPEVQAHIQERLLVAHSAIEQLSPRVREVFVLRKIYGLKQREIAERLGISESTVEKHIARGLTDMARLNHD